MTDRLQQILADKRATVERRKAMGGTATLRNEAKGQSAPRGFEATLRRASANGFGLIAEIKRASPSKGLIREDFDPPAHAAAYAAGGATCLSVLTDQKYFQGKATDLIAARQACTLPVLRKDFMVDPWQALEARAMGADAILLIVAALDDGQLAEIEAASLELGMDVLVEVHDAAELERALKLRSRLIGVNNRDLRDFTVDPARAHQLARSAPDDALLVSESGIATRADLDAAAAHGIRTFLVGESLMRQVDVAAATRRLLTGDGMRLTHLDAAGAAHMVDVSAKPATAREATAEGRIVMSAEALAAMRDGSLAKGDALAVARVAGIMAAKRTAELVPLCHPLAISKVAVDLAFVADGIAVTATVATTGPTGVEMEALTAVSIALLTLYDMAKAIDRGMRIEGVRLRAKRGGRSGDWTVAD